MLSYTYRYFANVIFGTENSACFEFQYNNDITKKALWNWCLILYPRHGTKMSASNGLTTKQEDIPTHLFE